MDSVKFDAALKFLDKWLERFNEDKTSIPGFVVSISHKGQQKYNRAFGYANVENKEIMTPEHLFRIASHSKSFTATAIMQLVEQGKISLTDYAADYLPFLKENADERVHKITIEQMLSHGSGLIRDGGNWEFWKLLKPFPSKEEVIRTLTREPLSIENNTRFKYSNYAYALLGWIIEDVSGLSYVDYMEKNVIQPLGLKYTGAEYSSEASPYVTGYTLPSPNVFVPISSEIDTADLKGATSFYSTAADLCKFYEALMLGSGKLLSDESKKEMFKNRWDVLDDAEGLGYGLGLVCNKVGGRLLHGHGGGMPGNITRTYFSSKEGLVVSILTNSHAAMPGEIQKTIWSIIDAYQTYYDESSPHLACEGESYSIWGDCYYVPMGSSICEINLSAHQPFEGCSLLEHVSGTSFKYVRESGYGFFGEVVHFTIENGQFKHIQYKDSASMNRETYLAYLDELKSS